MDSLNLPVLSLADPPAAFTQAIGESFRKFGFALVRDHGLDPALIAHSWTLTEQFFARPDAEKRHYHVAGGAGARGYTPFRTETAKGASISDLKEFWHVGRDLPPSHPLEAAMPANIWPDQPEGFAKTFRALYSAMDRTGSLILSRIALHLGLPDHWFNSAIADGNSVLRLLHYPPIQGNSDGALRAEAHEDINLVTLLLGAEESGLQLQTRDGHWLDIAPPPGVMVVNIGDMLERLTNHALPSTTHRVRNPLGDGARRSRYAMPFFLHLRSDFLIETLPQCINAENPDQYPNPITADTFLQERLREIGLAAP